MIDTATEPRHRRGSGAPLRPSPAVLRPYLDVIPPETPEQAPEALRESLAPVGAATGRFCAHCGEPIDAGMYGTKLFCSRRCTDRHATGLPVEPPAPKARRYSTTLAHPGYSIETCPKCGFPEADAGYCADCGWTAPMPGTPGGERLHSSGTCHGPTYGRNGVVVSAAYPPIPALNRR